jgi:hypothetical protein
MHTQHIGAALLLAAFATVSMAQDAGRRNGDHPAVVVQRLQAQQGYDYAAKAYPHPAWLYLEATGSQASATGSQGDSTTASRGAAAKPVATAFKTRPAPLARSAAPAGER